MFVSDKIEVREIDGEKKLFAVEKIEKDELILEFEKNFIDHPTRDSLQIDVNKHQYNENKESAENFINHSCSSNGYINFDDVTFKASRDIEENEEITFNYLTTEWDMANKFDCDCKSNGCLGRIEGFKYLDCEKRREILEYCSPFLKKKYQEECN